MLHQITWQVYLLFVAAVLLLYYAIIWLTFYRGKTAELLKPKQQPQPTEQPEDDDLLGEAAEEYGVSIAGSDELFFGPNEPGETGLEDERNFEQNDNQGEPELPLLAETGTNADEQELLQADLPDLMEDVKAVFHFIRTHEPEAHDLFVGKVVGAVMFYKRVINSDLLPTVLDDISGRALSELGFEVSVAELTDKLTRSRDLQKATFGAKY
jgi:hypothetical protein